MKSTKILVNPALTFEPAKLNKFVIPDDPAVLGRSTSIAPGTEIVGHVSPSLHPLLETFMVAWATHGSVKLSPDDVWHVIMTTVGTFVNECPKAYFTKFDSDNKKEIRVDQDRTFDPELMFEQLAEGVRAEINDDELFKALTPKFESTTPLDTQLTKLCLLNTVKRYFEFSCQLLCGIREIEVMGRYTDWYRISRALDSFVFLIGGPRQPNDNRQEFMRYIESAKEFALNMARNIEKPESEWWKTMFNYAEVPNCVYTVNMTGNIFEIFNDKSMGGTFEVPFKLIDGETTDMVIEAGFFGVKRTNEWFEVAKGWQYTRADTKRVRWESAAMKIDPIPLEPQTYRIAPTQPRTINPNAPLDD